MNAEFAQLLQFQHNIDISNQCAFRDFDAEQLFLVEMVDKKIS